MKFYGEPNQLVRVNKKGKLRRVRDFRFNENGVYETDNPHLINALKRRFKAEETVVEHSDDDIRKMAKEKGIKSWHIKSIETLKKELGV